ncbi:transmembrane reductase oxidoreductase [Rhodobacter sp. TJ_12]|uniref:NADPH-dependent F420 reductase n=1 Tax=Rhodobacter sp. TJ_12 TaxID=2029399 RepID=UPI001CBB775F|nr:transmembrane reductase oxidoreductase [Rhodobacter sp. TJ_12]
MKIGILGSGLMGAKLGKLWAQCGHDLAFAYARSPAKLAAFARETGGQSGTVADVVARSDVLLLAVHWSRVADVLEQAGDLAGKVVLNCSVPLNDTNTALVLGPTTSGAEELAKARPQARWVGCFNTSPSESFAPVFARKGQDDPPQLLVYGEDPGALEIAHALIRDIGFAPCPAGGLRTARFVEPFAMVTAELAYDQPGGPALTYRFEKLRG